MVSSGDVIKCFGYSAHSCETAEFSTKVCRIQHKGLQNSTQRFAEFNTKVCGIQHKGLQDSTQRFAEFNTKVCGIRKLFMRNYKETSFLQIETLLVITFAIKLNRKMNISRLILKQYKIQIHAHSTLYCIHLLTLNNELTPL